MMEMDATDARIDARIKRLFPFELTAGQEQAIREITADMAQEVPMNRLLQGEVVMEPLARRELQEAARNGQLEILS